MIKQSDIYIHGHGPDEKKSVKKEVKQGRNLIYNVMKKRTKNKLINENKIFFKEQYQKMLNIKDGEVWKTLESLEDIQSLDKAIWKELTKSGNKLDRLASKEGKKLYDLTKENINFLQNQRIALKNELKDAVLKSKDIDNIIEHLNSFLNRINNMEENNFIGFMNIYKDTNKNVEQNSDFFNKMLKDYKNNVFKMNGKLIEIEKEVVTATIDYFIDLIYLIDSWKSNIKNDNKDKPFNLDSSINGFLSNLIPKEFGEYLAIQDLEILLEANNLIEKTLLGKDKADKKDIFSTSNSNGTFKADAAFFGKNFQLDFRGEPRKFQIEIGFTIKNYLQESSPGAGVNNSPAIEFKKDALTYQLQKTFNISSSEDLQSVYNYLVHNSNEKTVLFNEAKKIANFIVLSDFVKSISGSGMNSEKGERDFAQFMIVNGEIISIFQLLELLKKEKDNPISAKIKGFSNVYKLKQTRIKDMKKGLKEKDANTYSNEQVKAFQKSKIYGTLLLSRLKTNKYNLK